MTFALAPAVAAVGLGSFLSAGFIRDLYFALKSKQWPTIAGSVTEVDIVHGTSVRASYDSALVGYEYHVRGIRYTSRRIDYAGRGAGAMSALNYFRHYHEGQSVVVHYDPNEPARAVLETGLRLGNFLRLLFSFVVLGFGLLFLLTS
jgi:hypothetical protein